jgi:hypothetical protein
VTGPDLLARAVERTTLGDHDGRSGASIERVVLDDGTRLVVKLSRPDSDITLQLTGGIDRERLLWSAGVLDRLGDGVGHAIIDAWDDDGVTVTVMRDLGDAVPGWTRRLSRDECRQVCDALASLHRTFVDAPPADLCTLETRLAVLSPNGVGALTGTTNPLPPLVARGWELFAEVVDRDVAGAVAAVHRDPGPLADALRRGPVTMLHADLWLVNLALLDSEVVLLDWAIATVGPAALDMAVLVTGAAAHVDATREQMIDDFRAASGDLTDDATMELALLAGLADMGWNKALDAVEHDDPAMRARERADLDWWVARARRTLDAGLF